MKQTDYDSSSKVSTELAVVRWGRTWYVLDRSTEATIAGSHPSKTVAIAVALRLIERGDYR